MATVKFDVEQIEGVTVVTLLPEGGSFSPADMEQTSAFLLDLTTDETLRHIAIDLSETAFFGSPLVTVLFRVYGRLRQRDGRLAVCRMQPNCRDMLALTRLDTLWPVCETREEAVAALNKA